MKVDVRPLNKGETYCCSVKQAKYLFRETQVSLNFAFTGREFKTVYEHPIYHFVNRNIKGKIIAYAWIGVREANALLNFFSLKESEFSNDLKEEFELKFLSQFYDLYIKQLSDQSPIHVQRIFMCVELFNGKLIKHTATI